MDEVKRKEKNINNELFTEYFTNYQSPSNMYKKLGESKVSAFQQKILNCRVVGARQSFQIFRQNMWFLENSRALSKFLYGILYYLISTIKL